MLSAGNPARVNLKPYSAELPLGSLAVGVDNIHHDVFLSPGFVESSGAYLLEFIRQIANLTFLSQTDRTQADHRTIHRRESDRRAAAAAAFCAVMSALPSSRSRTRSWVFALTSKSLFAVSSMLQPRCAAIR